MYAPEIRKAVSRSTDGELLVKALRGNEFKLHYKPIVDARSGELRTLETFLRWHPGVGERAAGVVHAARRTKRLGPAVGDWVKNAVFRRYQEWLREGLPEQREYHKRVRPRFATCGASPLSETRQEAVDR